MINWNMGCKEVSSMNEQKTFSIQPSPNIIATLAHSGYKIDTSIAD